MKLLLWSRLSFTLMTGCSRETLRNIDSLPETMPALYSPQLDDENRVWLATVAEQKDAFNYWVLNSNSELLAHFDWPKINTRYHGELHIQEIRKNFAYIRESDVETGLDQIVRYPIELVRR